MSDPVTDVITVPERADIHAAEALLAQLLAMDPETELHFDASAADQLSTPYVLTIVSAISTRTDKIPPATVTNPSTAFVDAFTDLGLFQDLMKMEFAS
ncbi:MAG: hypothetical protein AAF281_01705 [Pseudomonadota bacterium]